jgi:hypothetical protein
MTVADWQVGNPAHVHSLVVRERERERERKCGTENREIMGPTKAQ